MYRDYIGACAGMLTKMLAGIGGQRLDIPSYIELAHPERKEKDDDRSGREILDGLISRMKGGG